MNYAEDDEEEELTPTEEAYQNLADSLRWLYFEFMLRITPRPNFQQFKLYYLFEVVEDLMNRIDDKYADHVEAQRNELDKMKNNETR